MKRFNIITWNVNGLKSCVEKGDFKKIFNEEPDILCLQEVKNSDKEFLTSTVPKGYYFIHNEAKRKGYSGVALYSKKKPNSIKLELGNERFDEEGRLIIAEYDTFKIINLYMPHGGRDKKNLNYKMEVAKDILKLVKKENEKNNIIICTDFNIAHKDIDLARPKENKNNIMYTFEERQVIEDLINGEVKDVFREFNSDIPGLYTWWPYAFDARNRNLGWRIDYIFADKKLKFSDIQILKNIFGSDHCPTKASINIL